MNAKTLSRGLIVAAAFVAINSMAASHTGGMSGSDMMKHEMMDTNKDGMVSKEEYLAAMGKTFDMKAKEMKAKDGKMSNDEFRQFLRSIGGGQ